MIADVGWADGSPVTVSPRAILHRQLDRLAERRLAADVATELEFIVFDEPYRQAWANGYRGLTPASDYNIDYAISASSRMEPLLRDIRQGMTAPACASKPSRANATEASRKSVSATPRPWSPATTTSSTRTAPRRSPTSTAKA